MMIMEQRRRYDSKSTTNTRPPDATIPQPKRDIA